jgi:hypothetical protein
MACKGISLIFAGLDHRDGLCGVLHMTVESMGGSAHTQIGNSADVETAQSMYPSITPGHAKTEGGRATGLAYRLGPL